MNTTKLSTLFSTELELAYKPLSKDEEIILISEAQRGCTNARNAIINSQLKKLAELARSYMNINNRCDVSELMSYGIAGYQGKNGLNEAINKFDITKGLRFISFAYRFMMNPMRDFSQDNRIIRVPRNLGKSNPKCPKLVEQYTYEAYMNGMSLDDYIVHRNSKCNGEPISLRSKATIINTPSLDTPLDNDASTTLEDMIEGEFVDMDLPLEMQRLNQALSQLDKEEQLLIKEHFWDDKTNAEIGESRGVSRQLINLRINRALDKATKRYKQSNLRSITIKG